MKVGIQLRFELKWTSIMLVMMVICGGAFAEDGIYLLERQNGMHRIGNTPAMAPTDFPINTLDFEITEDGRGVYYLDNEGRILTGDSTTNSKALDVAPSGSTRLAISRKGYAVLDQQGMIHFGGGQPALDWDVYFGWEIARDIELTQDGNGMIVVDGMGGLYPRGEVPNLKGPYFGWDIVRDIEFSANGKGYYLLDGYGFIHSLGEVPEFSGENLGWDIARDLEITQSGQGYYILDGFGGLHIGGDAVAFDLPYFGWDVATDLEISPQPLCTLTGLILGQTSEGNTSPVPGAIITLKRIDLPEEVLSSSSNQVTLTNQQNRAVRTRSNGDGVYTFESISAGNYSVCVLAQDYETFQGEVEVVAGNENTADFVLVQKDSTVPPEESGTVQGLISEDVGLLDVFIPIPNARVQIIISNRRVVTTRTNEQGEFEFENVPVGNFPIKADAEGYKRKQDRVEVKAGETAYVSFQLEKIVDTLGRVYGVVWSASYYQPCPFSAPCPYERIPVVSAELHLIPVDELVMQNSSDGSNTLPVADNVGWYTTSNDIGFYEFNEVPLGKYVLIVRAEGYYPARRYFELGENCRAIEQSIGDVKSAANEEPAWNKTTPDPIDPVNLGEYEGAYIAAMDYTSRSLEEIGLANQEFNPINNEWPIVRNQLREMIDSSLCPVTGILGGVFYDAGNVYQGQWFSFNGEQEGSLEGNYTPNGSTNGGTFDGIAEEVGTDLQALLDGVYDNAFGWGHFNGEWVKIVPEGTENPANGRLFGLWRRFSDTGGYFIGLWTNCTLPCNEKEVNVRLFPLMNETGSIHGNVSALAEIDSTSAGQLIPIPGAMVHAIPLNLSTAPGEIVTRDGQGNYPSTASSDIPQDYFTTTDEHGNYRFAELPSGRYELVVTAEGYSPLKRMVFLPGGVDLEENFILRRIHHPQGRIEGVVYSATPEVTAASIVPATYPIEGAVIILMPHPVTDETGDPIQVDDTLNLELSGLPDLISDMEISRRYRTVTSAADGSYSFENVPIGRYRLVAKARDYYPQRKQAAVFEDETTTVNFELKPKLPPAVGSLIGSVTDAVTGDPVVRAVVTAWPIYNQPVEESPVDKRNTELSSNEATLRPYRTLTNADGEYEFARLPVGWYQVTVRARGYEPARDRALVRDDQVSLLNFALRPKLPDGSVVGSVRQADDSGDSGQPIPGALVTLIPWDLAASSDTLSGLKNEDSDPAGQIYRTRTNGRGYYEFPEIPAGQYLMRVEKQDYQPARRRVTVPAGETIRENFELVPIGPPPSGTVVGTVYALDEGGGEPEPIPGAYLFLFEWDPNIDPANIDRSQSHFFARSDRQGEYEFDEVPVGDYLILVFAAGFEFDFRKVEVLEDEITQANFFLTPNQNPTGARIYGWVTNEDGGDPLARVEMVLYLLPPDFVSIPEFDVRDSGLSSLQTTYTNRDGYYEFEGLDEGLYLVLALKEGWSHGLEMVSLEANEEKQVDFQLSENGSSPELGAIFGVVKTLVRTNSPGSSSYQPIAGASVSAQFASEDPSFAPWPVHLTRTDSRGQYRFEDLHPLGPYRMVVEAEGYQTNIVTVEVEAGEEVAKNFIMSANQVSDKPRVFGQVTTYSAEGMAIPVPGAIVTALMPDHVDSSKILPYKYTATTNENGEYELILQVDMYTICVEKEGYVLATENVYLEAGDVVNLDFIMEKKVNEGIGTLGGKVVTTQERGPLIPIPGAKVILNPHSYMPLVPIATETNESGIFGFSQLIADIYDVTVEKEGFEHFSAVIEIAPRENKWVRWVLDAQEEVSIAR